MTLPEKYPINKENAIKYKFIDFHQELTNKTIEKETDKIYYITNT